MIYILHALRFNSCFFFHFTDEIVFCSAGCIKPSPLISSVEACTTIDYQIRLVGCCVPVGRVPVGHAVCPPPFSIPILKSSTPEIASCTTVFIQNLHCDEVNLIY